VRLGPYGNIEDVNRMRKTMTDNGIEAQLIKVR
jgi:cell division protein FtsN